MRENLQAVIQNTTVVYRLFLSPKLRRIRCLGFAVRTLSKEKWVSISVEQRPFDADAGGKQRRSLARIGVLEFIFNIKYFIAIDDGI